MPLQVNNCCFFINLRTGSQIIGYLSLIWNIILTGLLIASLVEACHEAADATDPHTKTVLQVAMVVLAIALVLVLLTIIFSVLLLVGIYKNIRGYVKAYLIYTVIFVTMAVVSFFINIGQGAASYDIIRNVINVVLSVYYLLVVRSYFLKMEYAPPMMSA